nr:nudix hydrolase 18, mitochondrial-like [Ipomoea batatas]
MQIDLKTTVASPAARAALNMQRYDNGRRQVVGLNFEIQLRYKDSDETSSLKGEDFMHLKFLSLVLRENAK